MKIVGCFGYKKFLDNPQTDQSGHGVVFNKRKHELRRIFTARVKPLHSDEGVKKVRGIQPIYMADGGRG